MSARAKGLCHIQPKNRITKRGVELSYDDAIPDSPREPDDAGDGLTPRVFGVRGTYQGRHGGWGRHEPPGADGPARVCHLVCRSRAAVPTDHSSGRAAVSPCPLVAAPAAPRGTGAGLAAPPLALTVTAGPRRLPGCARGSNARPSDSYQGLPTRMTFPHVGHLRTERKKPPKCRKPCTPQLSFLAGPERWGRKQDSGGQRVKENQTASRTGRVSHCRRRHSFRLATSEIERLQAFIKQSQGRCRSQTKDRCPGDARLDAPRALNRRRYSTGSDAEGPPLANAGQSDAAEITARALAARRAGEAAHERQRRWTLLVRCRARRWTGRVGHSVRIMADGVGRATHIGRDAGDGAVGARWTVRLLGPHAPRAAAHHVGRARAAAQVADGIDPPDGPICDGALRTRPWRWRRR